MNRTPATFIVAYQDVRDDAGRLFAGTDSWAHGLTLGIQQQQCLCQ
jgi:hypothetical protein